MLGSVGEHNFYLKLKSFTIFHNSSMQFGVHFNLFCQKIRIISITYIYEFCVRIGPVTSEVSLGCLRPKLFLGLDH